jgi:lactoylglutathione lyase
MKNILFLSLILLGVSSFAQSLEPKFNHNAFVVTHLDDSAHFFNKILLLTEIETSVANPKIRWFSLGDPLQLHLIEVEDANIVPNKAHHLALNVADMNNFVDHLNKNGIPYEDWLGEKQKIQLRPDGVHQIYIQDPDGHWIEINDAK